MKLKHIFSLLFLVLVGASSSQNQEAIDSLKIKISKAPDDSNKVNLIHLLSRQYGESNPKEKIENLIIASNLAKKVKYKSANLKITNSLINLLYYKDMNELATLKCREFIAFCEKNRIADEKFITYNILANLLLKQEKYGEAIYYFKLKGENDMKKDDFKSYGLNLHNQALAYFQKAVYDSSIVRSLWSAEVFKRNNMEADMANAVMLSGKIYLKQNNAVLAEEKTREALDIFTIIDNKTGMVHSLSQMAQIYSQSNLPDSAIHAYKVALIYADSIHSSTLKKECYKALSELLAGKKGKEGKLSEEYSMLYKHIEDSIAGVIQT